MKRFETMSIKGIASRRCESTDTAAHAHTSERATHTHTLRRTDGWVKEEAARMHASAGANPAYGLDDALDDAHGAAAVEEAEGAEATKDE